MLTSVIVESKIIKRVKRKKEGVILSIKLEKDIRKSEIRDKAVAVSRNFSRNIFFNETGASLSIQKFLPSRLHCGKTNLMLIAETMQRILKVFKKVKRFLHIGSRRW